jgi:hypothetical protein
MLSDANRLFFAITASSTNVDERATHVRDIFKREISIPESLATYSSTFETPVSTVHVVSKNKAMSVSTKHIQWELTLQEANIFNLLTYANTFPKDLALDRRHINGD